MAVWQFSVSFIPTKNLVEYFGYSPTTIDDEILWRENLEEGVILPENYESFLSPLGEQKTLEWGEKKLNWGDYDNGTHLTISFVDDDDDSSTSIFGRFHAGDWNENFAKTVLEFAKLCKCVLLTNNKNIIEPELIIFVQEMKKSSAYKFCKAPIEYLRSDEVKNLNWAIRKKLEDISE